VQLPDDGPTAAELYVTAIQHGVAYAIGTLFHTDGGGNLHIRLNFATHPPARIHEGFKRLGEAWSAWQESYAPAVQRTPIL
jgi:DNA-binding transcriptional MocR family regulator